MAHSSIAGQSLTSEECKTRKDSIPEWILAKEGIKLIINDNGTEAEKLFLQYPNSLVMYAGYAFAVMMDALMSFEEDRLNKALTTLREVERKCTSEDSWLKTVTYRVFGGSSSNNCSKTYAEQLETQIILADSQVCIATLTFLQQDITGYLKGSWVLRKAWKIYQRLYKEILDLYQENIGELHLPTSSGTLMVNEEISPITPSPNADWDIPEHLTNGKEKTIEKDVIIRLMGAVSFGYGLFQLGISLLPPSLIKLINFFGFSTNRENGLACLMYARLGTDMRSPLAILSLLWYHTIVRPFYAIDGTNVQAGVQASLILLKESEEEFGHSSLFLFYYGRAYRLNSDIKSALASFQQAVKRSCQREMQILCLHEIGWCHLIELELCEAHSTFFNLKSSSRWSKAFYCYLSAICSGSCNNILPSNIFAELKTLTDRMPKGTQLDDFLSKRSKRCPSDYEVVIQKKPIYWKLLVFEMLYLWNALPSCSMDNISKIISECSQVVDEFDEPLIGLSLLILGCAYNVSKEYENGIRSFRDCLNLRKNIAKNSDDAHISAFAQYELGALLMKNEQSKPEGRLLLQQIGQYSQFDFEQKLHVRVHSLLK